MSNNFTVKHLQTTDKVDYNNFVQQLAKTSPAVLGYHYSFYLDILEECNIGEVYCIALYNNDSLCAVLPGLIKKSELGVVYSSMPFFGPNASILCLPQFETLEVHQIMINFLINQLSSFPNILSASFYTPFLSDKINWYSDILQTEFVVDKNTQYLDIQNTEWSSKIRYDLRKAEKLGLTISTDITDEAVNKLYEIYIQNCTDYSIPPKPKQFVDGLAAASKNGENVDFYFSIFENEIVGGLIVVYSASTLSYYLPCSLDSARTLQPTTVMIDKAFEKAKQNGLQYWNWEASPSVESGVFQFKKKWGSLSSDYKIFIKTFQSVEVFKTLGKEKISQQFPYFFVFPFNLIN